MQKIATSMDIQLIFIRRCMGNSLVHRTLPRHQLLNHSLLLHY